MDIVSLHDQFYQRFDVHFEDVIAADIEWLLATAPEGSQGREERKLIGRLLRNDDVQERIGHPQTRRLAIRYRLRAIEEQHALKWLMPKYNRQWQSLGAAAAGARELRGAPSLEDAIAAAEPVRPSHVDSVEDVSLLSVLVWCQCMSQTCGMEELDSFLTAVARRPEPGAFSLAQLLALSIHFDLPYLRQHILSSIHCTEDAASLEKAAQSDLADPSSVLALLSDHLANQLDPLYGLPFLDVVLRRYPHSTRYLAMRQFRGAFL